MISGSIPLEQRYLVMTSAAARVSPGGLGDGACTNACKKEICALRSASIAWRRSRASIVK